MPGLWASMLCRKRFIDDKLLAAVESRIEAVVILGAGFDTPVPAVCPLSVTCRPAALKASRRGNYGRVPSRLGRRSAGPHRLRQRDVVRRISAEHLDGYGDRALANLLDRGGIPRQPAIHRLRHFRR